MGMEEAVSEWVTRNADGLPLRHVATPEQVAALLNVPDLALPEHDVEFEPLTGTGTQLLLRKRAGGLQLLFNGRESKLKAGETEHVLPRFRSDGLIREDASKRLVPAPVIAALLVEAGERAPSVVKLQVLQRTYMGGIQVDYGRETVATEVELRPTRPSDVVAQCVAVAYPMALSGPAKIVIGDNRQVRKLKDAELKARMTTTLTSIEKVLLGQFISAYNTMAGKLGAQGNLVSAAFSAAGLALSGLAKEKTSLEKASLSVLVAAVYNLLLLYANRGAVTTEERARLAEREVSISVFDVPALLERIAGYQPGGVYTNAGQAPDLQTLRAQRRFDDVLLIETLTQQKLANEYLKSIRESMETLGESKADIDKVIDELQDLGKSSAPNVINYEAVNGKTLRDRGYVETVYRIEVVDTEQGATASSRETFTIVSDRSWEAGIVASGYQQLRETLRRATTNVLNAVRFEVEPSASPLVRNTAPETSILGALASWRLGLNKQVYWPSMDAVLEQLKLISNTLDAKLKTVVESADTGVVDSGVRDAERRLPHLMRTFNAAGMAFVLEGNEGLTEESSDALSGSTEGLRNVISASAAVVRVTRQAIGQFLAADGVLRPRARLFMLVKSFPQPPLLEALPAVVERRGPTCGARSGIQTSLLYASRLPQVVVGTLWTRAEHPQLEQAAIVGWLCGKRGTPSLRSGAGMATALGLPASHESELVMGALAELALEDALRRIGDDLHATPTRKQLMYASVEAASEQLRLAAVVANGLFRAGGERGRTPLRLEDADAVFDCYPGGDALLRVLLELPAWREWAPPWTRKQGNCDGGTTDRFGIAEAAALALPTGAPQLLRNVASLLAKLRPTMDAQLCDFPFLSSQTLCDHAVDVLPLGRAAAHPVDPFAWHRAWLALAAHVDASHAAAWRVLVLARGARVGPADEVALLRESAAARPILDVAVRANVDGAPTSAVRVGMQLLDAPLDVADPASQAGLPEEPNPRTLVDNRSARGRSVLQLRLSMFRFDLAGLAAEPAAMDDDDDLVARFAGLSVSGAHQLFLCPFAEAFTSEELSTAGRHFEDTPVYLGQLRAAPPASRATALAVRAHGDDGEPGCPHPLLLRIDDGARVRVTFAHVPAVTQPAPVAPLRGADDADLPPLEETTDPTPTLRTAWAAAERAKRYPFAHGAGVDAATNLLFNVERLVQAVLALAALGHDAGAQVRVRPPKPPTPKRVAVAAEPELSPALLRARARSRIATVAALPDGLGRLSALAFPDDPAEAQAWVQRLKALPLQEPPQNDQAQVYMQQLLQPLENTSADALKAAYVESGRPDADWDDPSALLEVVSTLQTDLRDGRLRPRAPDDATRARLRHGAANQFLTAWRDMQEARDEAVIALGNTNRSANAENERRRVQEQSARIHEAGMWPLVLAIAQAVARTLVASPPELVLDPEWLLTDDERARVRASAARLDEAASEWKRRRLVAVPLCELVAVAARTVPV